MPVEIISDDEKNEFLHANGISKKDIYEMVAQYRKTHENEDKLLNFSHFTLGEIFGMVLANSGLLLKDIKSLDDFKNIFDTHGIRIYMAEHLDGTCPAEKPEYKGYTTTILCSTEKVDGVWEDLMNLGDKVVGPLRGMTMMDGLDQTAICKPDCGGSFCKDIISYTKPE